MDQIWDIVDTLPPDMPPHDLLAVVDRTARGRFHVGARYFLESDDE